MGADESGFGAGIGALDGCLGGVLAEPLAGEVLDIDEADGLVLGVENDEIIDAVFAEDFDHFGGEVIFADADGILGHVLGDGLGAEEGVFLVGADEIAVGEDAGE